jgi:hypothetical protein
MSCVVSADHWFWEKEGEEKVTNRDEQPQQSDTLGPLFSNSLFVKDRGDPKTQTEAERHLGLYFQHLEIIF